jgi:hypothetical protein
MKIEFQQKVCYTLTRIITETITVFNSPQNQALIGSAGNLVRTEDFLAIVEGGQDEEGDLVSEPDITPSGPNTYMACECIYVLIL